VEPFSWTRSASWRLHCKPSCCAFFNSVCDIWKLNHPTTLVGTISATSVNAICVDRGGNVWVAGGKEGLFLLRSGHAHFERFTMQDGLQPYEYMPEGSAHPGQKYVNVISVAGGPGGTVFVGYAGIGGLPVFDASVYNAKPRRPRRSLLRPKRGVSR